MQITVPQIKSALGMLEWNQETLARISGVPQRTLAGVMSREVKRPSAQTLERIREAFQANNIKFIENGVLLDNQFVTELRGEDCYLRLLEDVYQELVPTKGEILFSGASDSKCSPAVINMMERIYKAGITARFLIGKGDTFILGDIENYRWVKKQFYTEGDVMVIYGDKTAKFLFENDDTNKPMVRIMNSHIDTSDHRKDFEFKWSYSEQPTHKELPNEL